MDMIEVYLNTLAQEYDRMDSEIWTSRHETDLKENGEPYNPNLIIPIDELVEMYLMMTMMEEEYWLLDKEDIGAAWLANEAPAEEWFI